MLLKVENLVKVYGDRRVVNGVNLEVNPGEIVGLLGRNGAGKTTTFKMIIGMVFPTEGVIYFGKQEIGRLPIYQRARAGLGYLAQEPSVFRHLAVEDNLLAILETTSLTRQERLNEAGRLLAEYGLVKLARSPAYTLSGGEMRRLEICRTLITKPQLILLDEPFSGVDPIAVNELQTLIRKLKTQNISILLTDHNVRETLAVTDRSYIIDEGCVLCSGTPSEIMNNPKARACYLGDNFKI